MQGISHEIDLGLAQQVCNSCKTRKRKCNKALPRCSSCTKSNLTCEYLRPEQNRKSTSTSEPFYYESLVNHEEPGVESVDFPTVLFLDPSILAHGQVDFSQANSPVPAHVLAVLGELDEIRRTASNFFAHIHLWMPFISKKRFYDLHLRLPFESRPDIALLLLTLKLITTRPSQRNSRTPLYNTTKHFYLEVEGSSLFSLPVLQAGVLLALYELGHGIYPAAFLSIGACARYAYALGINVNGTLNSKRVLTLVEAEERKRVWWAIIILDRFVSIGSARPLATEDPTLDDLLPSDDAAWDEGIVTVDKVVTLGSPTTSHMSKFALLCQAARLLGQVLRQVSDSETHKNVWVQLDRTLQSMLAASLGVNSPDYDQISFVYSALVALHSPWLHSDGVRKIDAERFQRARAVVQQIVETMTRNLVENECFKNHDPDDLSPWGLFFAYRICVAHMKSSREMPDSVRFVNKVKERFLSVNVRWNVAGVYLRLLEAQEITNNM